jgi:uncharacterized protein (DUF983 family)
MAIYARVPNGRNNLRLARCPFCGSGGVNIETDAYGVRCMVCGVEMPTDRKGLDIDTGAITRWNSRELYA